MAIASVAMGLLLLYSSARPGVVTAGAAHRSVSSAALRQVASQPGRWRSGQVANGSAEAPGKQTARMWSYGSRGAMPSRSSASPKPAVSLPPPLQPPALPMSDPVPELRADLPLRPSPPVSKGTRPTSTRPDQLRFRSADAASPPLPKDRTIFDARRSMSKRNCVGQEAWYENLVWKESCSFKNKRNEDFEVLEANDTFDLLKRGASIFRFGDGELRLMSGSEAINHGMEVASKDIRLWLNAAASMGGVARHGAPCAGLVGIMDGNSARFNPKSGIVGWTSGAGARKYQTAIRQCFPKGRYCSASITRADHLADWDEDRLVKAWASVFESKVVLYIRAKGMFSASHEGLFARARAVIAPDFIDEPRRSFSLKNKIMYRIHEELRRTRIDMVALSLGPTATIIAAELACQGVQALDFGSWTRRR